MERGPLKLQPGKFLCDCLMVYVGGQQTLLEMKAPPHARFMPPGLFQLPSPVELCHS